MKHDTRAKQLAKQRRKELLWRWEKEGKIKLLYTPNTDYKYGVKGTIPITAVQVGEHIFNDANDDLYPSEFLVARIALALEAGQGDDSYVVRIVNPSDPRQFIDVQRYSRIRIYR